MASQKQIDANRRNAQRSTGPSSPSGKNRSRRNALRDGLTGQITTLSEKDRPFFEQLQSEMLADLRPQDAIERSLANAIAWDTWRLNRLRAVETNIYALGQQEQEDELNDDPGPACAPDAADPDDLDTAFADARTFRAQAPRLELMSLYEQRMTRNLHRNLAVLRNLQAERKRNYERDKREEVTIGRICEINEMPIKASAWPSRNGFIFSNEEIAVATVRDRYIDTAAYVLKHSNPNKLYGNLRHGVGDSILEKEVEKRPLSKEELDEIQSVPPEIRATHRLNHPDEYGIR